MCCESGSEQGKLLARFQSPEAVGGLFNAGFGGGTRPAIDIREGEMIAAAAFKALIKEGVAHNIAKQQRKRA
ncbi:MAG: hypothetical protein ACRDG4_20875 [Chloroflexota bacterium]